MSNMIDKDVRIVVEKDLTKVPKKEKERQKKFFKDYIRPILKKDVTKMAQDEFALALSALGKAEASAMEPFVKAWRAQGREYSARLESELKKQINQYMFSYGRGHIHMIEPAPSIASIKRENIDVIWKELKKVDPTLAKSYSKSLDKLDKMTEKKIKAFEAAQSKKPVIDSCPYCGGKLIKDWDEATKQHKKRGDKPVTKHTRIGVVYKCKKCGRIIKRERIMGLYY